MGIFEAIENLRKLRELLDDGAVRSAARATEQEIGKGLVIEDALRQWSASPEFQSLVVETTKRGLTPLSIDAIVASFIEAGDFFAPDVEATAHRVVESFLRHLDSELVRRAPHEVTAARQQVHTAMLFENAARLAQVPPAVEQPRLAEPAADTIAEAGRRTRAAIVPWVLPPVSRRDFTADVIRALRLAGTATGLRAIVAPAGYGKTTVLAQIYDEIAGTDAGFVALVRCDELPTYAPKSVRDFDAQVSEAAGCASLIDEARRGGGILLLDTVDLLLSGGAASLLPVLLRAWNASGLAVLFTCRDFEFSRTFEPLETQLAGIAASRHALPMFSDDDVRIAARQFVLRGHPDATNDRADTFAQRIFDLSADRRRLQEIVRNPLLLAMLCDLFGPSGDIPEDLTTSLLYSEYWQRKIATSRDRSMPARVAQAKLELCHSIGHTIAVGSMTHLRLSVSEGDLAAAGNDRGDGLAELRSEGVLVRSRHGYYSFFHQTLAEFTVAKWLVTEEARAWRDQLLRQLATANGYVDLHWWPVVRQLVALVDDSSDVLSILDKLDLDNIFAFRAVALAAASRADCAGLPQLCARAIGNEEKEQIACQALESAPRSQRALVSGIAIELFRQVTSRGTKRVRMVLLQLLAHEQDISTRTAFLAEALEIVTARGARNLSAPDVAGLTSHLLREAIRWGGVTSELRASLRERYGKYTSASRQTIIELHLLSDVDDAEVLSMFEIASRFDSGDRIHDAAVSLVLRLLDSAVSPWRDFVDMLHRQYRRRWAAVQGNAAGKYVAARPEKLSTLIIDVLHGDARHVTTGLIALREAAIHGDGASRIVAQLRAIPLDVLTANRVNAIAYLLSDLASSLSKEDAGRTLDWVLATAEYKVPFIVPAMALSSVSDTRVADVLALYTTQPAESRIRMADPIATVVVSHSDPAIIDTLAKDLLSLAPSRKRDRSLVAVIERGLRFDRDAFFRLLVDLAASRYEYVALDAAAAIDRSRALLNGIDVRVLFPLLSSPFGGVRGAALETLLDAANTGALRPSCALRLLTHLRDESINKHRTLVLSGWIGFLRRQKRLLRRLYRAHAMLVVPLFDREDVDGGVLREAMHAQSIVVRIVAAEDLDDAAQKSLAAIKACDLRRARDASSALRAVIQGLERRLPGFLDRVVHLAPSLSQQNQIAIAEVVRDIRGPSSLLLQAFVGPSASKNVREAVQRLLAKAF